MREFAARYATTTEVAQWDDHVIANPHGGDMLQSASFADVKKEYGWKPVYLVHEPHDGSQAIYTLVLEKTFPVLGRLWYMVKGPAVETVEDIAGFSDATRRFVQTQAQDVFLVKMEPVIPDSQQAREAMNNAGLMQSLIIQPNDHTAVVNTERDPEDIMKGMQSNGRNKLRRAIREEARVERVEVNEQNMRAMYSLMQTARQGQLNVTLRPFSYYSRFWSNFANNGQGRLYFAYEDGEPSVGAFVVNYGPHATYKDGGSKPRRKQRGDAHLVQWTAMNDLMAEHAIKDYDLCGTPPSDQLKNEDHQFHGMGMFKTSFTKGEVVDYVGVWDQEIHPTKVAVWNRIGEKVARQLWVRFHDGPFY
ncbi:MAG: peptidoglycan bridge formation glycyltransferase FemA/FemB family protein [Kocuria sp.]|nr:peptidoglycan bridge formation glycyltransferase FemA/FemB family protein [Kocuria sp.]